MHAWVTEWYEPLGTPSSYLRVTLRKSVRPALAAQRQGDAFPIPSLQTSPVPLSSAVRARHSPALPDPQYLTPSDAAAAILPSVLLVNLPLNGRSAGMLLVARHLALNSGQGVTVTKLVDHRVHEVIDVLVANAARAPTHHF